LIAAIVKNPIRNGSSRVEMSQVPQPEEKLDRIQQTLNELEVDVGVLKSESVSRGQEVNKLADRVDKNYQALWQE